MIYEIVDAEQRNRENPDTFELPSKKRINSINVGDFVKLIFDDKERMWVKITLRIKDKWKGTLANNAVTMDLVYGDIINFHTKNIIDVREKT